MSHRRKRILTEFGCAVGFMASGLVILVFVALMGG